MTGKRAIGALCAVAAFIGAVLSPASAQTISALTAEQLGSVLEEANLRPSLTIDAATGAPVATGYAGNSEFYVRALDCSGAPLACENLIFFANFDLGRPVRPKDYTIVNKFNEAQVFGRAYVIPARNKVGVDYVIELGGGVTQDHLAQNIGRWADVIVAFIEKFREEDGRS